MMGRCPNCQKPYKPGAILCSDCGELLPESSELQELPANTDQRQTLPLEGQAPEDASSTGSMSEEQTLAPEPGDAQAYDDPGSDTVDFEPRIRRLDTSPEDDIERTLENAAFEEYEQYEDYDDYEQHRRTDDYESTTPGSDPSYQPDVVENTDNQATRDLPTDDEATLADVRDSDGSEIAVTLNGSEASHSADESEFELGDNSQTHQSGEELRALDLAEPEADLDSDEADTHALSGSARQDEQADETLELPPDSKVDDGRTMALDSFDTRPGTDAAHSSGTEGKLRRLWEGVAGGSANPMHSLHAVGLQASETIFERVATRKVADASATDVSHVDYQILDKLGEGAMGVVLSARQAGVDRIVALKTAKPNFQKSDESRRRFLYEAQITADLGHSNIVPIYELGSSEEGLLFYSMKLIEGTPWQKVIKKKTREENLEIFMKVCDAVAFAHSKGIIHRDLKPENTMLGTFGEVFVTDWGTAINLRRDSSDLAAPAAKGEKHLTLRDASGFRAGDAIFFTDGDQLYERQIIDHFDAANPNRVYFRKKLSRDYVSRPGMRVTKVMSMAGTPCYMSPEMAAHQLEKLGPASDIYILGAILFEIICGKPPHSGKSVTECLRAAVANEAIEIESKDALLTIALTAMATDVDERYSSVEELQAAVRQYRRHSESVALSDRSNRLLQNAIENKDYEAFSRTLFGYQDALELWAANTAAAEGLRNARLAFGQVAYEKGDYDLALQTLSRDEPQERELYEQTVAAKRKSQERESTLQWLKRAVAAVILIAIVGLSALTAFAFYQQGRAALAQKAAEEAAISESQAKNDALLAKDEALLAKAAAEEQQRRAEEAALAERLAKDEALAEKQRAEEAARAEEIAKDAALAAQQAAENSARAEQLAKSQAQQAAQLAEQRAATIQLGEYQSSLALAKSQVVSFDVAAARENLARLKDPNSPVFRDQAPDFDTWGWRRIQLLSNADLPHTQVSSPVSAVDVSPAGYAAIGTSSGEVQILRYDNLRLEIVRSNTHPGSRIQAIAISPSGDQLVYALSAQDAQGGLMHWQLDAKNSDFAAEDPVPIPAAGNRQFQRLAFTPDGSKLVAGISGGLWIWDTEGQWYTRPAASTRIVELRGDLVDLQPLNSETSFFTSRFQDRLLLGLIEHPSAEKRMLQVPAELETRISSAVHTGIDDQIALGLSDNRLMVAQLSGERLINFDPLEDKHRAPINRMISDGRGQLISASDAEPVAHVWRFDNGEWNYDSFLTGTRSNLAGIGWAGEEEVIGVDDQGSCLVWNVKRQKQRQRLQRQTDGQEEDYPASVVNVFAGQQDGTAVTLDSNGVIDLWNLIDGETEKIDRERWSYIGHTPGAELVDSAVDVERGIVVTAANLQNAERSYLTDPQHDWEFCLWDQASGNMLRRWTAQNLQVPAGQRRETIEQRISLVDQGQMLLYASDSATRLERLQDGQEAFRRDDFGSYFAVPHPLYPRRMMLVKRSGAVRLLDLDDPTSWEDSSLRNFSLADPSDIPLRGIWSADGERFYLVFATGGVAAFQWNGQSLSLTWSSRTLDALAPGGLGRKLQIAGARIKSHLDVDLALSQTAAGDVLHIATRTSGRDAQSRLTSVAFFVESPPELVQDESLAGIHWLHVDGNQARLTDRLHDLLLVDKQRVRGRIRADRQTFVSTQSANVYALEDGQKRVQSYGRPKLLSSTGSLDGRQVYVLLEGGAVWRFEWSEGRADWEKLEMAAADVQQIQASPDGEQLLLLAGDRTRLVNAATGELQLELGDVSQACWDTASSQLALARPDGSLHLLDTQAQLAGLPGEIRALEHHQDWTEKRIVALHFFRETWSDARLPPRMHLMVHAEDDSQGAVYFVALDPADDRQLDAAAVLPVSLSLGTRLAVSPVEGIFATGTPRGTLTIWFATPSWQSAPGPLFDLEGHRGAALSAMRFTSDGHTLITADTKNRLFGWLSRDPLHHR
jgi:serine/threonine protein kinase/WD40 repeat protein